MKTKTIETVYANNSAILKTKIISIQISNGNGWDETEAVLHEIENANEASAIAYAISKQIGCVTVRMCYLSDNYKQTMEDLKCKNLTEYVCRLSGAYIQSNGK